jgi:hypothetical protein
VQIVSSADGRLTVAWDEIVGGGRRIKLARARPDASGRPTFEAVAVAGAANGTHPALATTAEGTIVAWVRHEEHGNVIAVATVKR